MLISPSRRDGLPLGESCCSQLWALTPSLPQPEQGEILVKSPGDVIADSRAVWNLQFTFGNSNTHTNKKATTTPLGFIQSMRITLAILMDSSELAVWRSPGH